MNEATNALVLGTEEQKKLDREVSIYEQKANEVEVKTETDFVYVAELTKQVKALKKKAEEYWDPMREATYNAYQTVLAHKKQMTEPMAKAEKILKGKMTEYTLEQERKRREREEELRRLAEAEAETKLAEAIKAEQSGDAMAVEYAMAEAEVMSEAAQNTVVQKPQAKVKGISKTKTWRITEIDAEKVPVSVAGAVIRPVDEQAILRLVKASKGQIAIPGVKFEESYNISVTA